MTDESQNSREIPAGEAGFQSLRRQMEQTRAALASKLNSLQKRVTGSVDTACDAVDETVHTAKKSALDAVQAIKCTLDIKQQAKRHPWTMLGVATCLGALLAKRSRDLEAASAQESSGDLQDGLKSQDSESAHAVASRVQSLRQTPNMKQRLGDRIKSELAKLQDEAITTGANVLRDWMERTAQRIKNKSSCK